MKPIDKSINPKKAQQAALVAIYEKTNELVEEHNRLAIQLTEMKSMILAMAMKAGVEE